MNEQQECHPISLEIAELLMSKIKKEEFLEESLKILSGVLSSIIEFGYFPKHYLKTLNLVYHYISQMLEIEPIEKFCPSHTDDDFYLISGYDFFGHETYICMKCSAIWIDMSKKIGANKLIET
jgi:hypothetical protein